MEYDAEIQVSIGEYEFIKICKSGDDTQSLVDLARQVQNQVHGGEGIPDADFNAFLDRYLMDDLRGGLETYEKMNKEQQTIVQAIKRSKKRIKSNQE